jgi:hypothetical protein
MCRRHSCLIVVGEDALDGGPSEDEAQVFEWRREGACSPTTDSRAPWSAAASPCLPWLLDGPDARAYDVSARETHRRNRARSSARE